MPNNSTHALVSAPPRIPQDSARADEEPTAAEWTSDGARTRNSMESTAFTPLNEQANTVLEPRQAHLKLSLYSSVAQPSPQNVARRSAQSTFKTLLASRGTVLRGHVGTARQQAHHEYNSRVFQRKRRACQRPLRVRAVIAVVMVAAIARESSAAFAPNTRTELQAATFGCVGACGQALEGYGDGTRCGSYYYSYYI